MLDDQNVLDQRDPDGALEVAAEQCRQCDFAATIEQAAHDGRPITRVIVAGMGGSALAALLVKAWLKDRLPVPFEVVRTYDLPGYVNSSTLVIASSYSGNTEETTSALAAAHQKGAQVAVLASGGKLLETAKANDMSYVQLPSGLQPRMAVIYNLRGLTALLAHFAVVDHSPYDEIGEQSAWLAEQTRDWRRDVSVDQNYAKQLALLAAGKTPVIYASSLMSPVAYKWKISWNENAKNVAFWNEYPEFNHNEFMGWGSHPVEKPFAIFDLVSSFDHPQIKKRFAVSDRLLSGLRPKATVVELRGESVLRQMLWASILADYVSIYVAVVNGVNPTPVGLIEKLKNEL